MSEQHGCWVVVRTCVGKGCPFPDAVRPVAEIEFPSADPKAQPVKKRYLLDKFCGGANFEGPVRVPSEIGDGKAKVTISFEAWKGGQVSPSTVELPIRPAEGNGGGDK